MSFYSNLAVTARKLLTDKGQQVTLTRSVTAGFDPVPGIDTPAASTTITGYGAAFGYNKREIDGTLIQSGDIRFVLEATTSAPENGDTMPIDSTTYRVMNVRQVNPAGIAVLYECQLRE